MAKRKIIRIDEHKCNGCGKCIPNCPEGALQIIDGKARLISDIFCDGIGACIGRCPLGAISFEEREAGIYDEKKVMDNVIKAGKNTIIAHLQHLKDHGEKGYLKEALEYLEKKGITINSEDKLKQSHNHFQEYPGVKKRDFNTQQGSGTSTKENPATQLRQWPIQLHLIPPTAPFYQESDVLLTADCVAYTLGNFHQAYLKGKSIAIACPKLDTNQEIYLKKIVQLIEDAQINSLTVMIMQVPCCNGLLNLSKKVKEKSKRKIPVKSIIVGIKGEIIKNEWI